MLDLEAPLWEIVVRTTAVYLVLTIALRFIPKRHAGSLSPNDLIALVIIGGLTADAIAVGAASTLDLLLMVGVVFCLDYFVNWLEFHLPRFRQVSQDSPTLLIHNGRILEQNLRRELMTEEELVANLRKHGVQDVGRIKQAVLEVDGNISTIENDSDQ